jgi:hypothetical protein
MVKVKDIPVLITKPLRFGGRGKWKFSTIIVILRTGMS